MNNDIRPPQPRPAAPTQQPPYPTHGGTPQPAHNTPVSQEETPVLPPVEMPVATTQPPRRNRSFAKWALGAALVLVVALLSAGIWYMSAIRPVDPGSQRQVNVSIETGMSPNQISATLKQNNLIQNELAFAIYTRLNNARGNLLAGNYQLSPAQSLADIVAELQKGQSSTFTITFYPGATLFDPTDIEDAKRTDVYTMLRRVGYSDTEVRAALDKTYDHPLLTSKPKSASLEGYVYGDTYEFERGTPVEKVLERTFDEFYQAITSRKLVDALDKRDMTLHQGVILASIIEREVSGRTEDQKQVSQIFHLRLKEGMPLGADATFMYAAQQQNRTPTINFDSPYNTRKVAGLPPGPISSPNITALEAAAKPAAGDYLYFVSGDDGTTHFARTLAEHESNTRQYCTDLCYSIE